MATPWNVKMLLNRLNWDVVNGDTTNILEFQLDVYRFRFKKPLEGDTMKEFTEFVQELDMSKLRSIMMIWIWLYQHGAKFRIMFGYNPRLPIGYNLSHLTAPKKLGKQLMANGHDDIMACPLDELMTKFAETGQTNG